MTTTQKKIRLYIQKNKTQHYQKQAQLKFKFDYRDVNYYKSEIELLFEDIKKDINNKKIIVLAGNEEETNKFGALLTEQDIPNKVLTSSIQMGTKGHSGATTNEVLSLQSTIEEEKKCSIGNARQAFRRL